MKVGIIGAGKVGAGLGALWARAGHDVVLSFSRDRARLEGTAASIGARAGSPAEAAAADVVVLAPSTTAIDEALEQAGSLEGKVLVDCTNYVDPGKHASGAEAIAAKAPGACVVKAFNTLFSAVYDDALAAPEPPHHVFCGDDAEAKELVATLSRDAGYEPVDAGPLSNAADVEAFARLIIDIAYERGKGPFLYWFGRANDMDPARR